MANGMTIKVRMHPMYIDFVKHLMGCDEKGMVFASENEPIGMLIKNLLRTQPESPKKITYTKDEYIEFTLPNYNDVNTFYRNYISETAEKVIAMKIRKRFYYEVHEFIIDMHSSGLTEKRSAIILFCEQFEIKEDHYKANSLEIEYRRSRKKQKKLEKSRKIASPFASILSILSPLLVLFT